MGMEWTLSWTHSLRRKWQILRGISLKIDIVICYAVMWIWRQACTQYGYGSIHGYRHGSMRFQLYLRLILSFKWDWNTNSLSHSKLLYITEKRHTVADDVQSNHWVTQVYPTSREMADVIPILHLHTCLISGADTWLLRRVELISQIWISTKWTTLTTDWPVMPLDSVHACNYYLERWMNRCCWLSHILCMRSSIWRIFTTPHTRWLTGSGQMIFFPKSAILSWISHASWHTTPI